MRINHNISGLNTLNKMQSNNTKINSALEKLSSGIRINKAADDSAGLAISEKMKAQIRGLERAERNIQDGISLVDTAEAGLAAIQEPNLIRLRELSIQAANDTLSADDRRIIQNEVNQIIEGIDQIANNTEFNTIKLLNGTTPASSAGNSGNTSYNFENVLRTPPVSSDGSFLFGTNEGYPTTNADDNQTLVYDGLGGTSQPSVRIDGNSFYLKEHLKRSTIEENGVYHTVFEIQEADVEITQSVSVIEDKYEIKYTIQNNGEAPQAIGFQYHLDTMLGGDDFAPFIINGDPIDTQTVYDESGGIPNEFIVYNQSTGAGANAEFQAHGIVKGEGIIEEPSKFAIGYYNAVAGWDFNSNSGWMGDSGYSVWWEPRNIGNGEYFSVNTFYGQSVPPTVEDPVSQPDEGPYDLILQTGANAQNHFHVQLSDVRTTTLGISNLNVLTREMADQSIEKIDRAIETVTSERTKYGSYHNALDHIHNNVSNYKMNLTNAESRLRDLDISKEMTKLANARVILQASQSMLAQSNQISQSVLEFLK